MIPCVTMELDIPDLQQAALHLKQKNWTDAATCLFRFSAKVQSSFTRAVVERSLLWLDAERCLEFLLLVKCSSNTAMVSQTQPSGNQLLHTEAK